MNKFQRFIIFSLLIISTAYSAGEIVMRLNGLESSTTTIALWSVTFAILIALWAQSDAEARHKEIPFEYSFLVFLLWPPMLAYYLIKTQGLSGCLKFLGFVALYSMPFVVGLSVPAFFV